MLVYVVWNASLSLFAALLLVCGSPEHNKRFVRDTNSQNDDASTLPTTTPNSSTSSQLEGHGSNAIAVNLRANALSARDAGIVARVRAARRERIRNNHLEAMKSYILRSLGFTDVPTASYRTLSNAEILVELSYYNNTINSTGLPGVPTTTQMTTANATRNNRCTCHTNSCPPNNLHEATKWRTLGPKTVKLYFRVASRRNHVRVHNATLFLQLSQNESCYRTNTTRNRSSPTSRILISVYQFTRRLRANRRARKRLIDAKMVSRNERTSVTLDVVTAAQRWLRNSRRNYGVQIFVKDMYENLLDANCVFSTQSCTTNGLLNCEFGSNSSSIQTSPSLHLNVTEAGTARIRTSRLGRRRHATVTTTTIATRR